MHQFVLAGAVKREHARRAFVEDDSDGVDVASAVRVFCRAQLFRRHLRGRSQHAIRLCEVGRAILGEPLGNTEIETLWHTPTSMVTRESNVARLQIAMNDSRIVR